MSNASQQSDLECQLYAVASGLARAVEGHPCCHLSEYGRWVWYSGRGRYLVVSVQPGETWQQAYLRGAWGYYSAAAASLPGPAASRIRMAKSKQSGQCRPVGASPRTPAGATSYR